MGAETICKFYADDHDRLDGLFALFQDLKRKELERAKEAFRKFKSGLEQHMAWEEAILFSEYEAKTGIQEGGPTEDLRFEHEQIRDQLENIGRKLNQNDLDTEKDEARLGETLAAHNWMEETDFYLKIDKLLTDEERAKTFERMKQSEW